MSNTATRLMVTPSPTAASPSRTTRTPVQGAATEVIINVGAPFLKVGLCRLRIKRVSGTAANFTPFITSKTGAASGSIDQEFLGGATAVGTLFDPATLQSGPVPMVADQLGFLYLVIQPDAGADNVFDFCARFIVYS